MPIAGVLVKPSVGFVILAGRMAAATGGRRRDDGTGGRTNGSESGTYMKIVWVYMKIFGS